MNSSRFTIIGLVLLVLILAVLQVFLLNQHSTSGEKLSRLEVESTTIEKENDKLLSKIASTSSLSQLSYRAQDLGMVKNQTLISLSQPLPVALSLERSL